MPSNSSVLLVDDDKDVLLMLQNTCEVIERQYFTAKNGLEALQIFKHNKNINLVITDIHMPEMNGRELLDELKTIRADISVVICTGYDEDQEVSRCIENGAIDVFKKPYDLTKLIDIINKH
jgi:CheY-like chemotaxis protein